MEVAVKCTCSEKSIEKLTIPNLVKLLETRGVEYEKRMKKPELVTKLKCAILKEELMTVRGILRS